MDNVPEELHAPYNPSEVEDTINMRWLESGYFTPETLVDKKIVSQDAPTFSMVLPPPNVTGVLHVGHALTITIEDIMIRYKRMKGFRTLWVPGTDHAAIATQSRVEKQLDKEKVKKQDIGRGVFLEQVQAYALENKETILSQTKRMGASLDWSREAFTLDDERQTAVYTAFKQMYDDGLIYRGYRVVNWDPKGKTTVSDEEVEHEPGTAVLYTFRYAPDFPIPIATTRPETKVGDTAVAVHPEDERYSKYIGETYDLEFSGVPLSITVVGDESVDSEFGTGAVGVTPAHSMADWELAQRHGLELKPVIDERAKMTVETDALHEKKTTEAREVIVSWLRENSLLEKEEDVEQNISIAQRSGGKIEPLPKLQWFVDVNKEFTIKKPRITGIADGETVTLKKLMRAAVESDDITFIPERFTKNYYQWIDNLHDWCISRQIWYGHRIPVWYCYDCNVGKIGGAYMTDPKFETAYVEADFIAEDSNFIVQPDTPEKCPNCGSTKLLQDPDTLDTWFSSGLWTFSTLGWPFDVAHGKPKAGSDLSLYHPTDMLETGYDILPFWVSRMILMSTYLLGEVPFTHTYLHGMVRDEQNRKMSKSLGNVIDPLDVIEKYGTDALRMALVIGNTPGTDLALAENKVKAQKNFANKIWNATRFVLSNIDQAAVQEKPRLMDADEKRLGELRAFVEEVTSEMDRYQLHIVAEKLYTYFWHTFADVIIEESKDVLNGSDEAARHSAQWMLYHVLTECLALLHPFMPFITEKVWSLLPTTEGDELLMVQSWPHDPV